MRWPSPAAQLNIGGPQSQDGAADRSDSTAVFEAREHRVVRDDGGAIRIPTVG
jgi:hypothetical protein